MPVIDRIAAFHEEMVAWRRHLHTCPETAFEEHETADFIAARLADFGVEVHRGLAGTGVIGTLATGDGPAVGLRADMDALDVEEADEGPYASKNPGKMHACGHDGHMAMLLGGARYLAETRAFKGTVHFIFQPAEEGQGGAKVMIEDGLFEKFPVQSIYGLHNWPELPPGVFGIRPNHIQAAYDTFEIIVKGKGGHAAIPHLAVDPIIVAAEIALALQTIASRNIHPMDAGVVSITQIHAGNTWNVIPDEVVLRGTTRMFKPEVQDVIEDGLRRIAEGVAATHGAAVDVDYWRGYPPTVNHPGEADIAAGVAAEIVGADHVDRDPTPTMGGEDFAFMLMAKPGCYAWLGNGGVEEGRGLHRPIYVFNDDILPIGASYWGRLVETVLG